MTYLMNALIATYGIFEVRNFGTHYAVYGCGQNIMETCNREEAINKAKKLHVLRPSWAN